MVKASAGGGGKGMRIVEKEEDLEEQMKRALISQSSRLATPAPSGSRRSWSAKASSPLAITTWP